jgi:hypothetical protein
LISTVLCLLYDFLTLKICARVPDPDPHPDPDVFEPPGTAFGSVSQRYGSEDPDPHPDPYQIVSDPQHCYEYLQWIPLLVLWLSGVRRFRKNYEKLSKAKT